MKKALMRVTAAVVGSALGLSVLTATPIASADVDYASYSAAELREELDTLEAEQAELAAEKATAEEKMKAASEQLTNTQTQIKVQKEQMADLESQLAQVALQQYQDRGLSATAWIIASDSAADLIDYMTVVLQVTDTTNSLFAHLQLAQGALLDLERSEQIAVDTITEEQARLDKLEEESLAKSAKVTDLLEAIAAAAAARAAAAAAAAAAKNGSSYSGDDRLIPPPSVSLAPIMRSYILTDPYGMRIHPFTGGWAFHDALDMAAPCGTPIYAAANGIVTDYYWAQWYGNRMVIDHGIIDGQHVVTSFNHLSGAAVRPGTAVNQGDKVAYVGTTGDSTGCHNHYVIWINGQTVDPQPYAGPPAGYGY